MLARDGVHHFSSSSYKDRRSPLNITGTRERYILDKSYWLVSSFNGNVVPLNGVHTELKRKGKNKGMKYKSDSGKETAIDR